MVAKMDTIISGVHTVADFDLHSYRRDMQTRADSKFSEMVGKIEHEGKSKESATKIAASIGRKKYGAKGMAEKAAAARRK